MTLETNQGYLGANTVFIGASGNSLLGSAYHCASIETLVTLQERLDAEEKKKKEIENEKKVAELFSKPHYWLICGKSPYSQALPSMTIAALRNFKPKAFDKKDSGKCADEAAIQNMVAQNFGIACICTDKEVKLNREKIEKEFGGAEAN
jgi:hypothetical protein